MTGTGIGRRTGMRILTEFTGRYSAQLRAFFIMAVCTRARVGPGLAPLAAAYMASEMVRGSAQPVLLAGCALGAFITGFDEWSIVAPACCALALLIEMALEFIAVRRRRSVPDKSVRASVTAGFSVLLPGLAAAGYNPETWAVCLGAAICAAALAPALIAGNMWWSTRLKAGFGACAAVLCCAGIGYSPMPAAVFCTLAAASAGIGAATGALLGGICAFTGGGAEAFAAACLMGAAADALPREGAICKTDAGLIRRLINAGPAAVWRALAGCSVYCALTLWLGVEFEPWVPVAALLQACVPGRMFSMLRRACAGKGRQDGRLVEALRRRDGQRLLALSNAFGELSAACGAGDPAFGEQQLINRMRAALCAGCTGYAECWPGSGSNAVKLFCQLMTSAIECGGSPFPGGEAPPEVMRLCRRGMTVPSRLGSMLADFAAQRHRRIRLMEARRLLAGQFRQASEVLNELAGQQTRPFMLRNGAAAHVRAALSDAGFPVGDVTAVKLDRLEINVDMAGRWSRDNIAGAERLITSAMDRRYTLDSVHGTKAVFVPGGALRASAVSSALSADPDHPCGDCCLIREMGGSMLVAVSDGMGSGEAAAEESCRVVSLMHSLVSAGMPRELAVSTVNGVLLSRGGEELFATADIMMIDLETGNAEFTKLAACSSYIVRGGRLMSVEGGRLPLGILDEVKPGISMVKLKRGDVVFMMTDGVADALREDVLEDLILNTVRAKPRDMAEVLINAAAARSGAHRDDMTAVCVSIA